MVTISMKILAQHTDPDKSGVGARNEEFARTLEMNVRCGRRCQSTVPEYFEIRTALIFLARAGETSSGSRSRKRMRIARCPTMPSR